MALESPRDSLEMMFWVHVQKNVQKNLNDFGHAELKMVELDTEEAQTMLQDPFTLNKINAKRGCQIKIGDLLFSDNLAMIVINFYNNDQEILIKDNEIQQRNYYL